eukprot:SAG31_NODE_5173_length_2700_cov_2.772011_2_plen_75_part_00
MMRFSRFSADYSSPLYRARENIDITNPYNSYNDKVVDAKLEFNHTTNTLHHRASLEVERYKWRRSFAKRHHLCH